MRFCLGEVAGRAWGSLGLLYGVRFIMIINDVDEEYGLGFQTCA